VRFPHYFHLLNEMHLQATELLARDEMTRAIVEGIQ